MTLELFISAINALKNNWDFDEDIYKIREKYNLPFFYVDKPDCCQALLDVLTIVMKDTNGWISYYCYESCFEECTVTDLNGNEMRIATPEDLYKALTSEP